MYNVKSMSSVIKETLTNIFTYLFTQSKSLPTRKQQNPVVGIPNGCEMEQVPTIVHFLKQMWRRDDAMPRGSRAWFWETMRRRHRTEIVYPAHGIFSELCTPCIAAQRDSECSPRSRRSRYQQNLVPDKRGLPRLGKLRKSEEIKFGEHRVLANSLFLGEAP